MPLPVARMLLVKYLLPHRALVDEGIVEQMLAVLTDPRLLALAQKSRDDAKVLAYLRLFCAAVGPDKAVGPDVAVGVGPPVAAADNGLAPPPPARLRSAHGGWDWVRRWGAQAETFACSCQSAFGRAMNFSDPTDVVNVSVQRVGERMQIQKAAERMVEPPLPLPKAKAAAPPPPPPPLPAPKARVETAAEREATEFEERQALLDRIGKYRERFPKLKKRNGALSIKSSLIELMDEVHYLVAQLGREDTGPAGSLKPANLAFLGTMYGIEYGLQIYNPLKLQVKGLGQTTQASLKTFEPQPEPAPHRVIGVGAGAALVSVPVIALHSWVRLEMGTLDALETLLEEYRVAAAEEEAAKAAEEQEAAKAAEDEEAAKAAEEEEAAKEQEAAAHALEACELQDLLNGETGIFVDCHEEEEEEQQQQEQGHEEQTDSGQGALHARFDGQAPSQAAPPRKMPAEEDEEVTLTVYKKQRLALARSLPPNPHLYNCDHCCACMNTELESDAHLAIHLASHHD
ncbi:hypothetical protein T492DRAFT_856740 [Pavlovales sp. CCMP2436]|nr:hypothetical protein T492DRAFT_856740 [Pavlovales sp. CCMP2436]